jgi:hypothetical protein
MPFSKYKDTIISIPYFNDDNVLNELIKFLQKLLLKKGVDKVYVERLGDLPKDEIYQLHLTQKLSPSKDFRKQAERYVHDYFILKENYLKEQLLRTKNRKKSDEFVMQTYSDIMPDQMNWTNLQNNVTQSQIPQPVVRQTTQRVRRGTAAVIMQQSANTLSDQIAQISMVSRQLQQLRQVNQTQVQVKTGPSNRQIRAQKHDMEQQERHRLVPRPTLNVFNKLMAEQELARKKKEEQDVARKKKDEQEFENSKKRSMQMNMRPKPSK